MQKYKKGSFEVEGKGVKEKYGKTKETTHNDEEEKE